MPELSWDHISDIAKLLVLGLLAYVSQKIKSAVDDIRLEQAAVKEKLLEKQNELAADFNKKHAENAQNIAVHETSDRVMFEGISRTLTRIDDSLKDMRRTRSH